MTYTKADVSEQQLEDLVRRNAGLIEEGLVYVDHQQPAPGGRLDVLMVDSGKSLVVAELKVIQDDGMLVQGLDYYDYVSTHVESFARLYKAHSIDATQQVRLFLVAPAFSQTLVNRCKWLDLPISLFTFNCLKFEHEDDPRPDLHRTGDRGPHENHRDLTHRGSLGLHHRTRQFEPKLPRSLTQSMSWKPGNISLDAIKYGISMKVNNRVFAYLWPRRQHYLIGTYGTDDQWKDYPVKGDEDLANVKPIMRAAMEKRIK